MREFNQVRQKAVQYFHSLIIQREAIGFRRHANVTGMYQIPPQKRLFRKTMYERIIAHNDMDGVVSVAICSYCFQGDDVRFTGFNAMKSLVANETAGCLRKTIDARKTGAITSIGAEQTQGADRYTHQP